MEIHFNPLLAGLLKPQAKSVGKKDGRFQAVVDKVEGAPQEVAFEGLVDQVVPLAPFLGTIPEGGLEDRRSACRYGKAVLDVLEKVRFSLIQGIITQETLVTLGAFVAQQRSKHIMDQALQALLNDIEVRAAVELAKFQRDTPSSS